MAAWRDAVTADPKLTTGASLPRAQLHDHIPALLEDFERMLQAAGDSAERTQAEDEQKGDAAAHGLHRWQQGFDLGEVTRELGRLNECVVIELEDYGARQPSTPHGAMAEARRIWAALYSVAVSASTSQYFHVQQLEAASHISELEQALSALQELEVRRAELWQQAAHDLRGNLGVVANVTAGLSSDKATADVRSNFLAMLERNVSALHRLLEDVTSLARLQGGQEHRKAAPMDASPTLRDVCEGMQPFAVERNLYLRFDGPPACAVEGDEIKIRRIVQNLVLNAIKYTRRGGVTVTWGQNAGSDSQRWFIQIQDTGPGFQSGADSKMAEALEVATDNAKEVAADAVTGEVTHVNGDLPQPDPLRDARRVHHQPGQGLGLSIVKRLCELLDATLEIDSKTDGGSTFRILLPRQYGSR